MDSFERRAIVASGQAASRMRVESSMKLDSVSTHPGFAAGRLGPLHLSIWDTRSTPEQAARAIEVLEGLGREEERVLVLAVLGANTPPPDDAVRDLFAAGFGRLGKRVVAVGNVIEGQGFRAATMRAVVTGLTLVIRAPHPQRTFATIEEGARFIAEQSEGRLTTDQVRRVAIELRVRATA